MLNSTGDLNITPSAASSERDFDFFHGKWKIRNRRLNERLTGCTDWTEFDAEQECRRILNGFGNIDDFHVEQDGAIFEAITLRLFDPKTRLWSIYWADSKVVVMDVPQVGSFNGEIGEFLARDVFAGKDIIVKFRWDKTDPEHPVWAQAFSDDGGETWEWNWYMYFEKF